MDIQSHQGFYTVTDVFVGPEGESPTFKWLSPVPEKNCAVDSVNSENSQIFYEDVW